MCSRLKTNTYNDTTHRAVWSILVRSVVPPQTPMSFAAPSKMLLCGSRDQYRRFVEKQIVLLRPRDCWCQSNRSCVACQVWTSRVTLRQPGKTMPTIDDLSPSGASCTVQQWHPPSHFRYFLPYLKTSYTISVLSELIY